MELEKVAALAFVDELQKILGKDDGAKLASVFHDKVLGSISLDEVAGILKQAGFFDRMKGFVQGGNQNGIPMHSLGSMLSQSNPMAGMGSSLASGARQAGGAIAGAAGAVGNFLRGGQQNGIPMHSLGSQLAQSNPMTGMGSSLASGARAAGGAIASKMQGAGQAIGRTWNGGANAQGVPMMGAKQQFQASNPMQGMMGSLRSNVPAAMGGGGSQLGGAQRAAGMGMMQPALAR